MIVKVDLLGKHVDFSKVVAISDARFVDRMGSGGYFVEFEIDIQLLDKPLKYSRSFDYYEMDRMSDRLKPLYHSNGKTLAELNLQKQIDQIVELWKEYQAL